jgi:hypothetical protein
MKLGKTKRFKIGSHAPNDCRDLFARLCNVLNLDIEKELKTCEVKEMKGGVPVVTTEQLFKFFKRHKLKGEFDFDQRFITVIATEVHPIGVDAIENPHNIKNTSVDQMPEQAIESEPEEELNPSTAPEPGSELTPMEIEGLDESDDDDDDPF